MPSPETLDVKRLRTAWPVGLLSAAFLASIAHFTPNAPAWDDYDAILEWLLNLSERSEHWSYWRVFDPHNEHRIAALRIISLLSGANFQLIAVLGGCFLALLAGALASYVSARLPAASRYDAVVATPVAIAVALMLFSPRHWETTYWAITAASALPCLAFAFAALWLIEETSSPRDVRFVLSILAAVASSLSQSNGLLVWPIGAAMLVFGQQDGYRKTLVVWLTMGTALAAVMFAAWPPTAIEKERSFDAERLFAAAHYTMRILGHGFSGGTGYLIAGVTMFIFLASVRRNVTQNLALFGLALFGLGSVVLISMGRSDLPLATAGSSRYALYAAVFLLASFLMLLLNRPNSTSAIALFVAAAVVYFVYGTLFGGRELLERIGKVNSQLRVLETTRGLETYSNLFAPADHLPRIADLLTRSSRAGLYSLPRSVSIAAQPEVRFEGPPKGAISDGGHIDGAPIIGNRLVLVGWHAIPLAEQGITLHVFGVPPVVAHVYSIRERSDVARAMNQPDLRFSGFELSLEFQDVAHANAARLNVRVAACAASRCYRLRRDGAPN
jgi:hypothetical protein